MGGKRRRTTLPSRNDSGYRLDSSYRLVGDGARDVVFIHGWMMTSRAFDQVVNVLDTTALRVCLVDLSGTGDCTLRRYATDVVELIHRLELDRPVIVGHSMGGQVAQLVAAALGDGVAGLALINPVPLSGLPLPAVVQTLFEAAATDPNARSMILDQSTLQLTADAKAHLLALTATVSAECIAKSLTSWTRGDDITKLANISAPTLVIATDDAFLPVPFLQQAVVAPIRNTRLEYLAGPGHYPHVEASDATAALLQEFFASVT